jgi:hypothetical protein
MTSLVVTAVLADAIVYSGDLIHLDGIISYGMYLRLPVDERSALPDLRGDVAFDFDLPLAKWQCEAPSTVNPNLLDYEGMLWGWMASCELVPWDVHSTAEYRKRPPLRTMTRYTSARTANIGAGTLKAYDLSLPTVRARRQQWYCEGNLDGVQDALARVQGIGRKHNTGYGTVLEWQVEETERRSCLRVYPQALSRMLDGHEQHRRGARIRPPYHHRSRHVHDCVVPVIP